MDKKRILKRCGLVVCMMLAGYGVYKVPDIITNEMAKNNKVVLSKSEIKSIKEQSEEFLKERSRKDCDQLLKDNELLIEEAKKMTDSDNGIYQDYIDLSEKLAKTTESTTYMQFKQQSEYVQSALQTEMKSLSNNLNIISKEYDSLEKKYKNTTSWREFKENYEKAEKLIKSGNIDVTQKDKIEKSLLQSYMNLYGGEKDA